MRDDRKESAYGLRINSRRSRRPLGSQQRMLLHEVGRDQADWFLIAKDGSLTAKVSAGLRVGEDEAGVLMLNPPAELALIEFRVDTGGRLQIKPTTDRFILLSPHRERCLSYRVEPYQGMGLWLPHNELDIANDIKGITKQYDDLPVTLVPNLDPLNEEPKPAAASAPPRQPSPPQPVASTTPRADPTTANPRTMEEVDEGSSLAAQLAPLPSTEYEAEELLAPEELTIPVLDAPIERVPEPTAAETVITELPYGFDPKEFTTSQPLAVAPITDDHSHRPGSSSRLTMILAVILIGVTAGLVVAELDLLGSRAARVETRTAFNPATPKLVLLSEAQVASGSATAADSYTAGSRVSMPPVAAADVTDAKSDETAAAVVAPPEPSVTPETTPSTPVAASTPEVLDTLSVFHSDLADATALFEQGFITGPQPRNTVAILREILRQEPQHAAAAALLKQCADRMVNAAILADQHGLQFEARNLLEEVMAFYPNHANAADLWQRWTDTVAREA